MHDWPLALWDLLAEILTEVESTGRWPMAFRHNLVCLLAKGGTMAPDDRRPIVLLSAVYRVWAALRAGALRGWLRAVGVLAPGSGSGADVKAGDLALLLEEARAAGLPVSGLAVDWSKCYDRLPLAALADVAEAAGVPHEIAAPMLAAYGWPRRIKVDDLASEEITPSCGLAPGCPCRHRLAGHADLLLEGASGWH